MDISFEIKEQAGPRKEIKEIIKKMMLMYGYDPYNADMQATLASILIDRKVINRYYAKANRKRID